MPKVVLQASFCIGLVMITIGHFFRVGAEFTAAKSFHHIVAEDKAPTHTLVTHGVYSLVRHPSYFGWMLWAVGTQFVLCNPISIVGFQAAAVFFFRGRIPYEECKLYEFFGREYLEYAQKTRLLMPWVDSPIPYGSDLGKKTS